jgi:hypothetical protein
MRHSRKHARRLGRTVPSRTRQPLSHTSPARIRQLSSTAGSESTTTTAGSFSLPSTLTIALGTTIVGIGSYYIGSRNDGSASTKAASGARAAEAAPTPVYGTQEDFKRAIKELQDSFEENMVSTDPSNLFTHGFSPNVMHEGESPIDSFRAFPDIGAQASRTP